MRDLRIYLRRLKTASVPELAYRFGRALEDRRLRRLVVRGRSPLPSTIPSPSDFSALVYPPIVGDPDEGLVREILSGKIFTLNTPQKTICSFEAACRGRYCQDVQPERGLDIRTVWEPARLQHLAVLLQYARLHPEKPLAKEAEGWAIKEAIRWVRENPFLTGPHYASAMECGLRIPVLVACLCRLQAGSEAAKTLAEAVYGHAWWVARRLSLYVSLGNHTVCECVGLVFAGAVFRNSGQGMAWLERGIQLLRQEISHQVLSDGGPAEQSMAYHRFVLDLYWLAYNFLKVNGIRELDSIVPLLEKGEGFLAHLEPDENGLPSIGDSDDGWAVAPDMHPERANVPRPAPGIYTFPISGYTVFKLDSGGLLTFNHGPLGMAPLYGHGHADCLSITLAKNGKELLVDPGTYRYNSEPEHRRYLKGTRAHNTVTIDGEDQAVQETSFIWSQPYRTKVENIIERMGTFLMAAIHSGYRRLARPVSHRRSIIHFNRNHFLLRDSSIGEGIHGYDLHFHIHPDACVEQRNGWWSITHEGEQCFVRYLGESDFDVIEGQRSPMLGWYSPHYGLMRKSKVLRVRKKGYPEDVTFLTAISLETPVETEEIWRVLQSLDPTKSED
ncbi:MAG: alginate lyase family protein [Deltaproteobacteria bacterium]|nr:alginate lyase family protein [Deltaproteobacteria bacterium]